jgi:type IV pilus modification protein PilV
MRAHGFSLVETMATVFLLSTGLLGAAGLLLDSLQQQSRARRQASATLIVADMVERIRANPAGREHYDSRSPPSPSGCEVAVGCEAAPQAAADLADFASAARLALPGRESRVDVSFEPAIGPALPDSWRVALRWRESLDAADEVSLVLLAQRPVAGA